MERIAKIVAWTVGVLLLLLVAAIIILPRVINPNAYRGEIETLVKQQTGRNLVIKGDLRLSIFPWLGVDAGATQLGNAPGFGPAPFAQFEHAKIKVKLLPLLRREVRLDRIELNGFQLHLVRNRDGRDNWEDLTGAPTPKAPPRKPQQPSRGPALPPFTLEGLDLREARVTWDDRVTGRHAEMNHVNLTTGPLDLHSPFPVHLETDFLLSPPQTTGHTKLKGTLHYNVRARRYSADDLALELMVRGTQVPGGEMDAKLTGEVAADLQKQTAQVKSLRVNAFGMQGDVTMSAARILDKPSARGELTVEVSDPEALHRALAAWLPKKAKAAAFNATRLESRFDADLGTERLAISGMHLNGLGLDITGEAQGRGILSKPVFTGRIDVAQFAPRDVLSKLGMTVPATTNPDVLKKAALSSGFEAGKDHAALQNLVLSLDQSTLKGSVAAQRFSPLTLRYDLSLDQIDADAYLPPTPKGAPAAPPAATKAATAPLKLPTDFLRSVDIDGTLRAGNLKAANLRSSNVVATLRAKRGAFRIHPVGARLYGGAYSGDLGLDVRGATPLLSMDEHLSGVQVGPLLKDFMGKDYVTGKAKLDAKVNARGTNALAIRQSLSGNASFVFQDGAVNGINIAQLIRDAYARTQGQPVSGQPVRKTDFSEMRGSVVIRNGLISNNDLSAKSPLLRVTGQGTASLVTEKIDYRVNATIVSTLEGQGGLDLANLKGLAIPIQITGTFTQPHFAVPVSDILKERANKELQAQQQKLQQQLQAEKKKREEEAKKRLEQELQKQFKGLLK